MVKHRRTRRSQKGGFWEYLGFGSSGPEDPNKKTILDSTKEAFQFGLNTTENFLGTTATNATNAVSNAAENVKNSVLGLVSSNGTPPTTSTTIPPTTSTTIPPTTYSTTAVSEGGRRRKGARNMKGGKGGLGLTYYASPVSGLKVAEPTSWQFYANGTNQYSVKGGSRKRKGRKSRRTRRHRKH